MSNTPMSYEKWLQNIKTFSSFSSPEWHIDLMHFDDEHAVIHVHGYTNLKPFYHFVVLGHIWQQSPDDNYLHVKASLSFTPDDFDCGHGYIGNFVEWYGDRSNCEQELLQFALKKIKTDYHRHYLTATLAYAPVNELEYDEDDNPIDENDELEFVRTASLCTQEKWHTVLNNAGFHPALGCINHNSNNMIVAWHGSTDAEFNPLIHL